jgi:tRNA G46 methylase TrmB
MSTKRLAEQHQNAAVIGLDKSAHRLTKHADTSDKYLLLRAECEPFWQLLVTANIKVAHHYLLYPNPWPKSSQLKRRVHGHPAFPLLARLGGSVEMRSNWQIFAEEFALASKLIGFTGKLDRLEISEPWTLFEKKYSERAQDLWCFRGIFSS